MSAGFDTHVAHVAHVGYPSWICCYHFGLLFLMGVYLFGD